MAKIPSKPKRSNKSKGTPPSRSEASQNTNKPDLTNDGKPVALNFKVPPSFKKAYKLYALEHGISMVDLLMRSFEEYKTIK
jgi:hypothetical protein